MEPGRKLRQGIGKSILLGLEIHVAADIIATVVADPHLKSVAVLAVIVFIRTFLSLSLQVELEGRFPWQEKSSVYLTTGMLEALRTEAELGGVLGHEIAHITGHHYREALAKNAALATALQILLQSADGGQAARMGAGVFQQLAFLRFSRANEAEADEQGTLLLAETGRNPLGIADYFQRVQSGPLPQWLSTHPGPENRVDHIRNLVESRPRLDSLSADSSRTSYLERLQENVIL